jgi:hypothetical protein
MRREKHRFLVPPPRDKRGGSGVAGVAAGDPQRGASEGTTRGDRESGRTKMSITTRGDPRHDLIESGAARGRQAVNLAILKGLREHVAAHAQELRRFEGIHGKFARDRARSIEQTLRILERVARLPADPATDYRGAP